MTNSRPRRTKGGQPEGPYEGEYRDGGRPLKYTAEMLAIVDYFQAVHAAELEDLKLSTDPRDLTIVLQLVRNHLTGRLTTVSSLAHGSASSYGVAYRRIKSMIEEGLILERVRTNTGKSVSLHPSAILLNRWHSFVQRTQKSMTEVMVHLPRLPNARRRSRISKTERSSIVPSQPVLTPKLALSRGLRILVHADPTFMAMGTLRRQLEMIMGVEIKARAMSIDRLREEIVANAALPISNYDVIACDLPWFGEMVARNRLLPLDELIRTSEYDLSDFLPDAIASTRKAGRQYGVPVLSTAELLVYRKDILDSEGLGPPTTVQQVLTAAKCLHNSARDRYGIAWNAGRGTALGHTFMVVMAAHGQPIVNLDRNASGFVAEDAEGERLRPMFLSDAARSTANYLSELMAYSPPDILSMTWYDRAKSYAGGQAAMAYCHTLLANLFELDKNSPAFGNTAYLPQPRGGDASPVSPLGGYALSIPKNSAPERIPEVWRALMTLTAPNAIKNYVANGSLASPRFSVNRDPEVRSLSPLIDIVDGYARNGTLRMWPRPPVPGISGVIKIAGEEIHDMLKGLTSIDNALQLAQDRADKLMREWGHY